MTIFLCSLVILLPPFLIFIYRLGLRDGRQIRENNPIESVIPRKPKPIPPTKDELVRMNIENYCGDDRGQLDV